MMTDGDIARISVWPKVPLPQPFQEAIPGLWTEFGLAECHIRLKTATPAIFFPGNEKPAFAGSLTPPRTPDGQATPVSRMSCCVDCSAKDSIMNSHKP